MPNTEPYIETGSTMQRPSQNTNSFLNLLSGVAGPIIGYYANKQQDKINRERQLEDFKMMAEYNSPIQQMQRFKDAGLNPHLIYGKDGGTVQQMPSSYEDKTDFNPVLLSQINNMSMDAELKKQQIESIKLDNRDKQIELDIRERGYYDNMTEEGRNELSYGTFARKMNEDAQSFQNLARATQEVANLVQQNEIAKQELTNLQKQWQVMNETQKEIESNYQINLVVKAIKDAEKKLAEQGLFSSDPVWQRKMLETMSAKELAAFEFAQDNASAALKIALSKMGVPISVQKTSRDAKK